jgi:DNA-binding MarR family transcriptional regulator
MLDLNCACASIRRTARVVTQLYSQEMGGVVEPAQYTLLNVLSRLPGTTQVSLGRALGMDKTTMSRNLRVMEKNSWVEPSITDDHRERGYRLTAIGKKVLTAAKPGWERAQRKLRAAIKPGEWDEMLKLFSSVAEAAAEANRVNSR